MDIKEKFTLDMLTDDSVSVKREKYIELDGEIVPVGGVIRNAYMNSEIGRELLKDILPDEYYNAVIAVWGDSPKYTDPADM